MIYRVAEVHITETLAGDDPGDTVEVFVPGGTDGMVTVHVSDWGPALAAGEDMILFLSEPGSFEALPPGLWIAGVDFKVRGQWAIDAIDAQLPVEELTRQIIAAGRR
jgi:hypothetical protein